MKRMKTKNQKKFLAFHFFMLLLTCNVQGQSIPDSVIAKYNNAKNSQDKIYHLAVYLHLFSKNDSIQSIKSTEMISYFKKQNDETGVDISEFFIATECMRRHDYATSLGLALPVLARFKDRNDTLGMLQLYDFIAITYDLSKNYKEAIAYNLLKIPIDSAQGNKKYLESDYNDLGGQYAEAFMPDSGFVYTQKALVIATELKDDNTLATVLSTLAENYIANKDYDFAMPFLRRAVKHAFAVSPLSYQMINCTYNDFAQAFLGTKHYDSTNYYTYLSISSSLPIKDQKQLLRSYEYLTQSFEATYQQDSANKYFRLAAIIKDSLYSFEKTKAIEAVSFRELMNQQEILAEKKRVEDERKQNIQYAFIGLGLIVSIALFLLLSRSVITNTKIIQFLGMMALLIVFEFLNLVLHPYLDKITHHTPLLMLLALVLISALLIPLHHRIEIWATAQLIEKNKAIRLAQAKKTIEKLEGKRTQTKEENTNV